MVPEEKLLKLIRSGHAKEKKQDCRKPFAGKKLLHGLASKIPAGLLGAAVLYCAISIFYAGFYLDKPLRLSPPVPTQTELKTPYSAGGRDGSYDGIKLNGRNIFRPLAAMPLAGAVADNLLKDIELVGIVLGKNPEAIIEDKKRQVSYRLTAGQFLNDIEICEIKEGRVIIELKGERFELAM